MMRGHRGSRTGLLVLGGALAALAIVLAGSVPASAVPPGWDKPLRIFTERFTPSHSMAANAYGDVLVATERLTSRGTWLLSRDYPTGNWSSLRLTAAEDHDPALAVDPGTDHFWVAFVRHDKSTLVPLGIWTASYDTGAIVVRKRHAGFAADPSIAIRGGDVFIAYRGPGHTLRLLSNATGGWTDETIASGCCTGEPSIALGSSDVFVTWSRRTATGGAGALRFASGSVGGPWSIGTVATGKTASPSLVVRNGIPFIAFVAGGSTWAASPAQSGWGRILVGSGYDGPPDLDIRGAGTALVVMGDRQRLRLATTDFGSVTSVGLTATGDDLDPEIVLVEGKPRVIFDRAAGGTGDGIYFTRKP